MEVDWEHLAQERHRVSEDEIRAVLFDGVYSFHEDVEGRFVARWGLHSGGLFFTVIFEILEVRGERHLRVLTAFPGRR